MPAPEDILDPRTEALPEGNVRPVVALPSPGAPPWLLALLGLAAALILFAVLESRRQAAPDSELAARGPEPLVAAPPPLYVPQAPPPVVRIETAPQRAPAPAPVRIAPALAPRPATPPPQIVYVPQQGAEPAPPPPPPPRVDGGTALVVDSTGGGAGPASSGGAAAAAAADGAGGSGAGGSPFAASLGVRARSGTLANQASTVPQGTLIPAVMETAFNSDRPGFARAIVSRDVRGFDGSRVLIPRGSRLIGEYRSDTNQGQKRALINWVRLVRPDGVTIGIGSPSTDTLGRGGVRAKVNNHFFQRFAGAILKSTVDIGMTLAAVHAGGSQVLVALPGTLQGSGVTSGLQPEQIRPTLKVPAARSISVFVARDLDFGGAGGR